MFTLSNILINLHLQLVMIKLLGMKARTFVISSITSAVFQLIIQFIFPFSPNH